MPVDQRARLKQWLDSGEGQLHPLTFPQRELWEVSPVAVEDNANHICCLIDVHGGLTEGEARAAACCSARHRSLLPPARPRPEYPPGPHNAQSEALKLN